MRLLALLTASVVLLLVADREAEGCFRHRARYRHRCSYRPRVWVAPCPAPRPGTPGPGEQEDEQLYGSDLPTLLPPPAIPELPSLNQLVPGGDSTAHAPAPAHILVRLPADAVLTIDDQPTRQRSAERLFVTPLLPAGGDHVYVLRAEVVRDGVSRSQAQRVTVRAGQTSRVVFPDPGAATVAANR